MTDARIEYLPLKDLKAAPRNPKLHNLPALGQSFDRFGFTQPLMMDERTGRLVAGHGRLEELRILQTAGQKPPGRIKVQGKDWLVPVIRGISFDSDEAAEAYLLADNRLVEMGGWDETSLAEIFRGTSEDFESLGWDTKEIADIMSEAVSPQPKPKEDYEPEVGKSKAGEIKLVYTADTAADLLDRMSQVEKREGCKDINAVLPALLDYYERNEGTDNT